MVKYSRQPANDTKTAKCRIDDLRAHYKNTYNTARACRGLNLLKAIEYLENVLEHKAIVPFPRYTGGPGRKAMCKQFNHHNGRFPEKACNNVINLLKNLKSNVEQKMLDPEKCTITHALVQRAVSGRRRTYRAHGRISPYLSSNCHVEFHAFEKSAGVAKTDPKVPRLTKKQAARPSLLDHPSEWHGLQK